MIYSLHLKLDIMPLPVFYVEFPTEPIYISYNIHLLLSS